MADQEIASTSFTLEARVDISFDASDITQTLKPLQIADLIEEIDAEVGEWEFTLLMYEYFRGEFETLRAKDPELAAKHPDQIRKEMVGADGHYVDVVPDATDSTGGE